VQRATASALTFFARFRTFVDPNAFGFPGLWISTNATWYQFPRLGADRRSLVVPTGAPHELPDGTLNVGVTRAYLPSSLFTSFGVEFTQDKVRELLRVSQEKEGVVTELPVTLTFDASGVQVDLPELTFSAPVLTFGATTTPSLPATGSSPLIVIYALLSTLSGVALVATRRRRVS
jgi:LPXTG-motif cell wall-anchored protein